jgi:hypothetical protein
MKIFRTIYYALLKACAFYTVISLGFYSIGMAISDSATFKVPTLSVMFMILGFSAALSALGYIFDIPKLPAALKYIIHFAATGAAFYFIFIVASGVYASGGATLVALASFAVVYTVCMVIRFIIKTVMNNKKLDAAEYENIFDNLKKDR